MSILMGVLAGVLALSLINGIRHGVIRRAVEVLGLLAVFLFASRLADRLEPTLTDTFGIPATTSFYAAWAVILIAGILLTRILAIAAQKVFRFSIVGWVDRLGGAVLGLVFGAIVCSVLLIGLMAAPVDDSLKRQVEDHPVTARLLHVAPSAYDLAARSWDGGSFFQMVGEKVDVAADEAAEQIKAFVDSRDKDSDDSNDQ